MSDSVKSEVTVTPTELAAEMGISPKNLRAFMRRISADRAGSGNRYAIPRSVADQIIARHAAGNHRVVTFTVPDSE